VVLHLTRDLTVINGIDTLVAIGALLAARGATKAARAATHQLKSSDDLIALTRQAVELVADQVNLGKSQVDVSVQAMQSSVRPLLVEVPPGTEVDHRDRGAVRLDVVTANTPGGAWTDEPVNVDLWVRNIGSGPAIIQQVTFKADTRGLAGQFKTGIVKPNEMVQLTLVVRAPEPGYAYFRPTALVSKQLEVSVVYADIRGVQMTETVLGIGPDGATDVKVTSVFLYDLDDNLVRAADPFARTIL
jgi:hypothetical protein